MGYYMGDFYTLGPYAKYMGYRGPGQGDPGFWHFLGGVAKSAVRAIPGVGPIISPIIENIGGRSSSAIVKTSASPAIIERVGRAMGKTAGAASQMVKAHPGAVAAGAAGVMAAGGAAAIIHHRGVAARAAAAAAGGGGGRRRRMNVCNPRALRRAIRRTHGFAKLAMKTIHIVHPKKRGRFGGFKKRRRK